jgi:hypothetical protein
VFYVGAAHREALATLLLGACTRLRCGVLSRLRADSHAHAVSPHPQTLLRPAPPRRRRRRRWATRRC